MWTEQDYFSPTAFRNFPNGFLGGQHGLDCLAWENAGLACFKNTRWASISLLVCLGCRPICYQQCCPKKKREFMIPFKLRFFCLLGFFFVWVFFFVSSSLMGCYIFFLFITLVFKKVVCTCLEAVTPQALSAAQLRPSAHDLCCCLMLSSKELLALHQWRAAQSSTHFWSC